MDSKLITLFGGSGFIGRYVVQKLAENGHRVRVAVRHPNHALFLKPLGRLGQVQLVQANLRHPESVAAAVAGADAVVNLVALLFEGGHQTFDDVQREGAITVARCAAAAGVRRLVHISAIGANLQSHSNYARTKAEAEVGVRSAFPGAVILRPSIVFGPEDGFFNKFAAMAKWPLPVMPVVSGATRFQPVYVGDVAQAIVTALDDGRHAGATFELGGPRTYSFRELIGYILSEIRVRKPMLDVPMPIARIQAALAGLLPTPIVTTDQLKLLQHDNVVAAGAKTLETLGITPTPLEAIVPAYLVRYRRRGQFNTDKAVQDQA